MNFKLLLVLMLIIIERAFASCGSENCPLYHFHYNQEGGLHLRLDNEYINQDRIYTGSSRSSIGAISEDHDEVSTLNSITTLQLQYGISSRLGIGLAFPYIHREHNHIHHEEGENHWENWNFSGLGDISIAGYYSLIVPSMEKEIYLGVSAGVKLPTGVTNAINAEGETAEVTLQPGSGSVDALLGLNFRYPLATIETSEENVFSTIPLIIGVSYKVTGRGTDNYKIGNTLLFSAGSDYQFTTKASLTLQLNLRTQGFADVGSTGEPFENTGGTWVYVSPGVNFNLIDNLSFYGTIQFPVYINVHGIQQASAFNLQLGLSINSSLL